MVEPLELLDIKEAARFLKVSETSLRRWTNAGLLPSLRIGGRHERRFRRADLIAFAEAQSSPGTRSGGAHIHAPEAPVIGGVPVAQGTHLCALYTSDAERTTIAAAFLTDGLRANHPAFLAATRPAQAAIIELLKRTRPTIDGEINDERLVLLEYASTPREQLHRWEALFARAIDRGATALRVVGDVSGGHPATSQDSIAEVIGYEEGYTDFIARRFPVVTLCLYDARLYTGLDVVKLFGVHSDTFSHPAARLLACSPITEAVYR